MDANKNENENEIFQSLVGPIAQDKAESMLTRATFSYVASISAMKAVNHPDLKAAMRMGRKMLTEMVGELFDLDPASAIITVEQNIAVARDVLRKS